jgi:DNA invertase Pin-like site-specific DNA recombinase
MSFFGYARVSTSEQDLGIQECCFARGGVRNDPVGKEIGK